jgi:hypothetical protein
MVDSITHKIGIDGGVHNGFAAYEIKSESFINVTTYSFFDLLDILTDYKWYEAGNFIVLIEDPNQNPPVWKRPNTNLKQHIKIAQDVGSNKRTTQLIIEYCQLHSIPYRAVKPVTSKWTATLLKKYEGFPKQSNQHERDAAKLCLLY